jgi:hypothetical protein
MSRSFFLRAGTALGDSGPDVSLVFFWNYVFIRGTAADIWKFLTGRVMRPDLPVQLAATAAHFLLIAACAAGFSRLQPGGKQWARFLAGGMVAVSYLLLLMITLRPEYIPLLKKCFGIQR